VTRTHRHRGPPCSSYMAAPYSTRYLSREYSRTCQCASVGRHPRGCDEGTQSLGGWRPGLDPDRCGILCILQTRAPLHHGALPERACNPSSHGNSNSAKRQLRVRRGKTHLDSSRIRGSAPSKLSEFSRQRGLPAAHPIHGCVQVEGWRGVQARRRHKHRKMRHRRREW